MRKSGISDDGPTTKAARSYNPKAVPTVATTLAGEAYVLQPIRPLSFEAEPITAEACTNVFGTTPAVDALAADPGIVEVTFSVILIIQPRARITRPPSTRGTFSLVMGTHSTGSTHRALHRQPR
jgi:hypothetical protein